MWKMLTCKSQLKLWGQQQPLQPPSTAVEKYSEHEKSNAGIRKRQCQRRCWRKLCRWQRWCQCTCLQLWLPLCSPAMHHLRRPCGGCAAELERCIIQIMHLKYSAQVCRTSKLLFWTTWLTPCSMSIIYFPFLSIMGWTSVFKSSNIWGLQDIEMRQPKLFNADFAVKTSEFRGC